MISGCPEGQQVDLGATVTIVFVPAPGIDLRVTLTIGTHNAVVTQNPNRPLEWDVRALKPGEVVAEFEYVELFVGPDGEPVAAEFPPTFTCTFTAVANTPGESDVAVTPMVPQTLAELLARFELNLARFSVASHLVGMVVENSAPEDKVPPALPKAEQEINKTASTGEELSTDTVEKTFGDTDFPCGEGEFGFTVCPAPGFGVSPLDGEWLFVFGVFDAPIPLDDPDRFYQYAFVFDSNANSEDNYEAAAEFPNDYFQGTDLWYSAEYSPQLGWRLMVTYAASGAQAPLSSAARIIIKDNVILLVAPADEFPISNPPYRVTAFCHDGGFGLDGGFWSGDLEPKVGEPLQAFD